MSVRVATGFRFVSLTEEAAAPLSQEDARLLRDIPGRNCRSLIPRCLIPFDYHPIAALPILYVDESHCLPLFPIATFPPHPRQSNRRRTETKGGTSSSSSSSSPNYSRTCFSSWKDFHPIPLASASTNDPIDSIHVVYLARHGQYRDNDNDSFFFSFQNREQWISLRSLLSSRRKENEKRRGNANTRRDNLDALGVEKSVKRKRSVENWEHVGRGLKRERGVHRCTHRRP